jgi:hypothetical protein
VPWIVLGALSGCGASSPSSGSRPRTFTPGAVTAAACQLQDQPSCPKSSPQRLIPQEIACLRALTTSDDHRHVPTGRLALLAQRSGVAVVSPSTPYRLVRERGWRRPRTRVLPQTEIRCLNSMIEASWRCLKHQWLFLNTLDTVARVRSLVGFYVRQHNAAIPHSAFAGQIPDEMYFGTGVDVPAQLTVAKAAARAARLAYNRSQHCAVCA